MTPWRYRLGALAAPLLWLLCAASALAQQAAPIPKLDSPVIDTTGTLDAASRQQLEQQALALQQRKGSQLQVLMVPTTQPDTIEQYTQRVFDQWKLGRKGVDDAVLLVVAKDDRTVRIQPGYGLEGAIPDITAGRVIREYLAPKFRNGDYAGGLIDATGQLVKLIDGEPLPEPMTRQGDGGGEAWLFALFAAFVVAQVARMFLARLPAGLRGLIGGAASGGVAWLLSSLLLVGGLGAAIGFLVGLISGGGGGRYVRSGRGGWGDFGNGPWIGSGGSGGGWGGGGSGGGWSGGGGMSGGGGASGSW